ncbi:hypothetical protein EIP91_010668 [Steccherinum ochraceum]|uniref:NADH:flavin oxidoreductase/NADH oxidase N-terminal domain-containing protein n=1 Tax=Steccherinum ochraceum TaxID=92696 RepID=A0A4R0RN73_9APHY|nr:hypothetical protein EIP91_010668 [Steccherinum ochraceum]
MTLSVLNFDIDASRVARADNVPFSVPAQEIPAGTAIPYQASGKPVPELFQPLTIRGVTFQNRIWVAPLAQYSSDNGMPTPWHKAHLGGLIIRGPGLTMMEATAVSPYGRSTPEDSGIWSDEHVAAFKEITDFAHSQNQKIGIQLVHAGRKASYRAMWLAKAGTEITEEQGGWPDRVYAPSAARFSDKLPLPKEMTNEDIKRAVTEFKEAAKRAVEAGFDLVELHGAHGFLLSSFTSPAANHRTDDYGGLWENRVRFSLEVIDAVRSIIPKSMPLFYRISATDFLEDQPEPSWRVEDTVKFAGILAEHGVDLIDISAGGNSPKQEIRFNGRMHQVPYAEAVKKAHGGRIHVAAVGGITNGTDAQSIVAEGKADVVFVGRQFLKNPGTVWQFAEELGVDIIHSYQTEWTVVGRGQPVQRRMAIGCKHVVKRKVPPKTRRNDPSDWSDTDDDSIDSDTGEQAEFIKIEDRTAVDPMRDELAATNMDVYAALLAEEISTLEYIFIRVAYGRSEEEWTHWRVVGRYWRILRDESSYSLEVMDEKEADSLADSLFRM